MVRGLFTRTAVCSVDCTCEGNGFKGFCKCDPAPGTRVIVRRNRGAFGGSAKGVARFTELSKNTREYPGWSVEECA